MKIYAINGGPRKGWNTDTMLQKFLDGAASVSNEVKTEMVYLYDLNYKGCISCFACQRSNVKTYGQCQVKDDIYDLLRAVPQSDGVVFGCPVYLHDITSGLRAFIERLVYQYINFDVNVKRSNAPKKLLTTMIYTMNVEQEVFDKAHYDHALNQAENYLYSIFGYKPNRICAYNTYQYKDYSQYRASYWNEPEKAAHHRSKFPMDCQTAFDAGQKMALIALDM